MTSGDAPRPPDPAAPDAAPPTAEASPAAPPPVLTPHDLRGIAWQSGPHGVREKRKRYGNTVYRLLLYPAGYKETEARDRQLVGLVLQGRATVQVRNRQRPVRAGQALVLPGGLPTKLRVGRSPLLLFAVETSKRRRRRKRGGRKGKAPAEAKGLD